ncbi:pituitary tumor-transforming gene 1 protein-interacting protein-like [Ylistrum balloti]|uniref:pituitary tumor-transforming gene 1 protein-interacting protein-like n=1 Tax=Ylistrum balloti TaxID=509963 RepID=UPI002905C666|nr:pituitary tumor-transforming gene 1 protein-interacting protein-like [Ylistrum balloti]
MLLIGCLMILLLGSSYGMTTGSPTTESPTTRSQTTEAPTTKTHTTQKPTIPPQTTAGVNSSTMTPEAECAVRTSGCNDCLKLAKCMWCKSKNSCLLYPSGDILPHSSLCPLDDARWGVCWVNFKVLLIVMGCIGGIIVLAIAICICCCCCKKNSSASYAKEEAKVERKKMERKAKSDERRAERKSKTDEIRRKYGLIKDDNPYSRFDA